MSHPLPEPRIGYVHQFIWITLFTIMTSFAAAEDEAAEEEAAAPKVQYIKLEPAIIVNFAAERPKPRYMRAGVHLQVPNEHAVNVEKHLVAIRHHLIMFLSGLTDEQTASPDAINDVRLGALQVSQEAVAQWVPDAKIDDLLFSDFVLQ